MVALLAALVVALLFQPATAPGSLDAIDRDARAGVYGNVDRLLVIRKGATVIDARYPRDYRDISRGRRSPIGCGHECGDPAWMHEFNYFHPDWHPYYRGRDVHTLQSVTKSIAATVIGIALRRGEIRTLDQPFLEHFTDKNLSRVDARLRQATIADVLTMRSGIEWHEQDRPLDETNTTIQLERSRDWIQFTLDQPMDAAPGSKWAYNSGGSQLLSGIIRSATGRFIDEYAREHLFAPLGITDFHWKKTPSGHPDTEGGLYLSPAGLARIGQLYLASGRWNGRRVLSDAWIKQATARHATNVAPGWDYGYQWWVTAQDGVDVWTGRGFGGQMLYVIPARETVAVVYAWNVFGSPARAIHGPLLAALVSNR
jgi:CubicO group peptidase (beta-lactamase class C family)